MRLAASACSRRERPNTRTCEQGVFAHVRMFACSRRIPPSPAEAGFKPPHYRLQRNEDNRGLRPQDFFVPFFRKKYRSQSSTGGSFAAFWSAKSGAKTDPPTKKAKRRGLTLAPGDYSRVCKQTVPSARAFSPHLFERFFAKRESFAAKRGEKSPHSRLQRKKNNRQPACPEREAA